MRRQHAAALLVGLAMEASACSHGDVVAEDDASEGASTGEFGEDEGDDESRAAGTCRIENSTCQLHPANAGTFDETQPSQAACFQRAVDWRNYCGKPATPDLGTTATWVSNPTYSTNHFTAYSPGCAVATGRCPNHPTSAYKRFWDDYQGSGSDQTKCLNRSQAFADWCGYPSLAGGVTVRYNKPLTGLSLTPGGTSASVKTTYARGCLIRNTRCVNFPSYAGPQPFPDTYNGAGTSYAACSQRASDYVQWCGGTDPGLDSSLALYYPGGTDFSSSGAATWRYPKGCRISNRACPNHPEYTNKTFAEYYNNAANDSAACFQRAKDYRGWCGGTASYDWTGADYTPSTGAAPLWSGFAYTPGCLIDINTTCPLHPDYSNKTGIVDTYNGAATSYASCVQRGRDYYYWCGYNDSTNYRSRATTATFTDANYTQAGEVDFPN